MLKPRPKAETTGSCGRTRRSTLRSRTRPATVLRGRGRVSRRRRPSSGPGQPGRGAAARRYRDAGRPARDGNRARGSRGAARSGRRPARAADRVRSDGLTSARRNADKPKDDHRQRRAASSVESGCDSTAATPNRAPGSKEGAGMRSEDRGISRYLFASCTRIIRVWRSVSTPLPGARVLDVRPLRTHAGVAALPGTAGTLAQTDSGHRSDTGCRSEARSLERHSQ